MLMITMREWFGQSSHARTEAMANGKPITAGEVRLRGFVTALSLGQALERIDCYSKAFNERYANVTAIEFELLQVSVIPRLTAKQIETSRAVHVEKLKQRAGDWDDA